MEEKNKQLKSILGKWWEPIRKWFYPAWLLYELSIRFSEYTLAVHNYFTEQQDYFASYMGEVGAHTLTIFCSVFTFVVCTAFLTVPASFVLYKFFKVENLTETQFEGKMKFYF